MHTVNYTKMNGLGNTFVIFDARGSTLPDIALDFLNQCVGYDQKIVLHNSIKADLKMQVYNRDGSPALACGNATRCVSRLLGGDQHSIEVGERILYSLNHADGTVSVEMGKPLSHVYGTRLGEEMELSPGIKGYVIDVGNPHVVLFDQEANPDLGRKLEYHSLFKDRINVNFVKMISTQLLHLVTWERGVGFTKACGTGACASAFMAHFLGHVGEKVCVRMHGGELSVRIEASSITMRGDACFEENAILTI